MSTHHSSHRTKTGYPPSKSSSSSMGNASTKRDSVASSSTAHPPPALDPEAEFQADVYRMRMDPRWVIRKRQSELAEQQLKRRASAGMDERGTEQKLERTPSARKDEKGEAAPLKQAPKGEPFPFGAKPLEFHPQVEATDTIFGLHVLILDQACVLFPKLVYYHSIDSHEDAPGECFYVPVVPGDPDEDNNCGIQAFLVNQGRVLAKGRPMASAMLALQNLWYTLGFVLASYKNRMKESPEVEAVRSGGAIDKGILHNQIDEE